MTEQAHRVEAAIHYARHLAADALDPLNWGFIEQGTTLSDQEAEMARRELLRLRESIQALIDQRFVEEALGPDGSRC